MRKVNYREEGITLVALVITIIILLILAGVTLNAALSNNGLFQRAKLAVEKYEESEEQEQIAINDISEEMEKITIDYNDYVGCYVNGYNITNKKEENSPFVIKSETSGVKETDKSTYDNIKDNLEQKFTTEELSWKIWDYDKYTKTIRLISARPANATLTLKGAEGYNNGVWAINEVCRQCYGQYDENGNINKGIKVENLKRSDIQKVCTYDYTNFKHPEGNGGDFWKENSEGTIQFGSFKTYVNPSYPKMWGEYDSKWSYGIDENGNKLGDKECLSWEEEYGYSKENGFVTGSEETSLQQFKQTYYSHDYKDKEEDFIKNIYYDLLFKNEDNTEYINKRYWLAGRGVHLSTTRCGFDILLVNVTSSECYLNGYGMYNSNRNSTIYGVFSSPNNFN